MHCTYVEYALFLFEHSIIIALQETITLHTGELVIGSIDCVVRKSETTVPALSTQNMSSPCHAQNLSFQ